VEQFLADFPAYMCRTNSPFVSPNFPVECQEFSRNVILIVLLPHSLCASLLLFSLSQFGHLSNSKLLLGFNKHPAGPPPTKISPTHAHGDFQVDRLLAAGFIDSGMVFSCIRPTIVQSQLSRGISV